MMIEILYIIYILNLRAGISLKTSLKKNWQVQDTNYLYLIQVMKFILNGKLTNAHYKHTGKTILLKKLEVL